MSKSSHAKKQSLSKRARLLAQHTYTTSFSRGAVQIKLFAGNLHPNLLTQEWDGEGGVYFLKFYGRRIAVGAEPPVPRPVLWTQV